MGKGKGGKQYTPNDMRSISKNPNNPAFKVAADNRANQLNPTTEAHASSRKGSAKSAPAEEEGSEG